MTASERAKSIRSAKLKRYCQIQCSRFSLGPAVALAYDSSSCVKLGSAVGNSGSFEELTASMTSLLFDRHFLKLKPPCFIIVFEFGRFRWLS